ncbi:uncharacterized protein [Spinacia oleracea]|uniref:Integrase catalytic domain-containing protein n=1 Tax=Spinacia oleracea TaxID=3562 RepID=A0ABM3RHG8_SPIOL|nr:uncharacterized protein LOC130469667 [Spinacia oleracea]
MASMKLRPYFLAHRLVIYIDQPLKLPFTKLEASGSLLNLAIELNAFDITYESRKAIKGQALADFIVEMTRHVFSGNTKIVWTVFVDGSSTQNGCGAGIICQSHEGDTFEYEMLFNFQASNNEAEYEALLSGIKMCKAAGAEEILGLSDSQLIVSQVNGNYEARDPTMIKYMKVVHQEVENLKSFEVRQVPRSENNQADALSKLASSASCDTPWHVFWEVKTRKSIEQLEAVVLDRTSTWMDDIINFKMNGVLLDDPKQAAKVQKKCPWFEMWNGTLYKKAYSRPLLRCVTLDKGQEILEDIHQDLCSSHIGGRALAEKALRIGYYWPNLKDDALSLVKSCNKCQHFSHLIHRPAQIMTPITSPIPFAKWGMDLLGQYTTAPGGRRYVIVVIDYFTKWVEAEELMNIKTYDVKAFIWKNIITRFRVPQPIIFDNGPQFETPKLKDWGLQLVQDDTDFNSPKMFLLLDLSPSVPSELCRNERPFVYELVLG